MIRIFFLFILLFGNLWSWESVINAILFKRSFTNFHQDKFVDGKHTTTCQSNGVSGIYSAPNFKEIKVDYRGLIFVYSANVTGVWNKVLYKDFDVICDYVDFCNDGLIKSKNGKQCVKEPNDECPPHSIKVLSEDGGYTCKLCAYNEKPSEDGLSCVSPCSQGQVFDNPKFKCVLDCPRWQKLDNKEEECVNKCPSGQKFDEETNRCIPDTCPADQKWNHKTKACENCLQGYKLNEQKECEKVCPLGQILDENDNCILVEEQECRNQGKCWSPLHSSPFFNNNGRCLDCKLAGDCDYNGKEIYTDFKTCEKCPSGSFPYSSLQNGKMGCARQPACDKQGGRIKVINGEEYCVGKWLQAPECAPGVPAKYAGLDGLINTEMLYKCDYSEKDNSISLPLKFIKLTSEESEQQPKEPEQGGSTGDTGNSGSQSDNNQDSQNQGGSTNQGDSSNAGGGSTGGGGSAGDSTQEPKPDDSKPKEPTPDTPQEPKPQEPTPPKKPDDTKPKEPKSDDSTPKPQNPDSQTPPPSTPPTNTNPPSGGGGGSGGGGSNTPKPNGGGGGNPSAPASGDPLTRALNNLEGAVRSNTGTTAGNSNALGKNTDALNRLIDALNGGLGGGGGDGEGEGQGQGNGQGEGVDLAGLWDAPLEGFESFGEEQNKVFIIFENDIARLTQNAQALRNGGLSLPNQKPATCGIDFEFYGKTIHLELCKYLHQISNIIYFIVFTFITVAYFRWSLRTLFQVKV